MPDHWAPGAPVQVAQAAHKNRQELAYCRTRQQGMNVMKFQLHDQRELHTTTLLVHQQQQQARLVHNSPDSSYWDVGGCCNGVTVEALALAI